MKKPPRAVHRASNGHDRTLLASVIDAAPMGVLLVDAAGKIVMANREIERITAYPEDQLVGRPLDDLLPQRSRDVHRNHWRQFYDRPMPRRMGRGRDLVALSRDGREVPVEIGLAPVEFDGESFVLASIIDISERKAAEQALRDSEARSRVLFDTVDLIVLSLDAKGNVDYVNPYLLRLTGYTPEEVLDQPWFERFIPKGQQAAIQGAFSELLERQQHLRYHNPIVTRSGEERMIAWTNTVRHDAQGHPEGTLSIGEDVTERYQLEAQLLQAQKMEAVGRLAGGIAHDFNNLLTAITGYAELLRDDLPPADPRREDAQEIAQAAGRAATLTRQLLAFSRQQVLEPRVLDLNEVMLSMEKLLRRLIGEDVELVTSLAHGLGAVRADPGQIEQVVVNLAVNSRDAMPEGGRLTIETAEAELDPAYVSEHDVVSGGPYVMFAVSDTGMGMTDDVKAHLFEPFFTTKEKGKGTGLGLATVYGIVKQSGGYIWAYSEVGRGTSFKVYLPKVEQAAESLPEETDTTDLTGTETVLIVEDEEQVRKLSREALKRRGYRVVEARRGDEALALLVRERPGAVQIMVTDLVLPGMGGPDLVERARKVRPELKVLFMSGYTDRAVQAQEAFPPGTPFLQKPFTPALLAKRVRQVLDA